MREFLRDYAVDRVPRWPLVSRLVAGSVLLHAAAIAAIAYIPTLHDAFNIAVMVGGSNYVDRPYDTTRFGEDVQMVQVTKFSYPEGYFAIGQGLPTVAPTPDPFAPKIISLASNMKPEPSPSPSPSPSVSPAAINGGGTTAQSEGDKSSGDKKSDVAANTKGDQKTGADPKAEEAQKQLEEVAKKNNIALPDEDNNGKPINTINRQPIKDLTSYANDLNSKGRLDLTKDFEVGIQAELDSNGKLKNPIVKQKSGDPNLTALATRAIGAINESGLLVYLKDVNDGKPTNVTFVVSQDKDSLIGRVETELGSEDVARQQAKAFSLLLALGQRARAGKNEEILLKATKATTEGRKLVFNFSMSRQAAGDLIKKQLAENDNPKQG
jgi:hypothetical protein